MDYVDLERLGLNRNEAKVYFGLLQLTKASAADLVKRVGVHRNIVYDNLEKLIEKGLVSFVEEEGKKYFIAEDPETIIEFLENEKSKIDSKITSAQEILPSITSMLKATQESQEVRLFRGVRGVKTALAEVLKAPEQWIIGISSESVQVLGETYWKNYNAKINAQKVIEHFLINHSYEDTQFFDNIPLVEWRRLPPELSQNTEIILFDNKVAFFIYTHQPSATIIEDASLFKLFMNQFQYLWKQAEK